MRGYSMKVSGQLRSINTHLKREIEKLSGQKLDACYLCGKCSAGCPVAPYQDIAPHVVMRLAQLGHKSVLESKMIWNCVSCGTCVTRCPNNVDPAKVCEALSRISKREGLVNSKVALALREKFVDLIKNRGRVHELTLVIQLKMASGDWFSDLDVGIPMFLQGKLPISGHRIKDLKNFKKLFEGNKEGNK
ncbi:MAG: 4Fe-4S dicluster domain-containing protein [Actinomycetota bacterium]